MEMKTQIILKTKKCNYNTNEILQSFMNDNDINNRFSLEKEKTPDMAYEIKLYIRSQDLIKTTIHEYVYFETKGFVSAEANEFIDKKNNETFIFVNSYIETEDKTLVKKFIYENEKINERVKYLEIACELNDILLKRLEKNKK